MIKLEGLVSTVDTVDPEWESDCVKCNAGHTMLWRLGGYSGGWFCDGCRESSQGYRFFCESCSVDYCKDCSKLRNRSSEHLREGDPLQILMSVYELWEGEEVNARGVWKATVHTPSDEDVEVFMFYAGNNRWNIDASLDGVECTAENEEQGEPPMMYIEHFDIANSALTPDKIIGTWHRNTNYEGAFEYVAAPQVRARVYTGPEDRQQAMAAARQCTDILLEGKQQGDHQYHFMGIYKLLEGKEMNGRGVWQMNGRGVWQIYIYYAQRTKPDDKRWHWWIKQCSPPCNWRATGDMMVFSTALTPDQVTETWQVNDGTAFVDAPKVRARRA
jgi:hypothetical protein